MLKSVAPLVVIACTVFAGAAVAAPAPAEVNDVASLRSALDAANGQPGTRVVLAGGTYFIDAPLVLTPEHSGVTIEAAPDAHPILSGGRKITGWRNATFAGKPVFAADVPGVKDGSSFFRELWVNDRRAVRARHPNRGYLHVKESPDATPNWEVGQSRFRYADGDSIPPGPYAFGAEAIVMTRWVESRLPLKSVDEKEKLVSFTRKTQWVLQPNDPYWLEGDGRWLDAPGEFFLDRASGTLYYLPREGETIDRLDAVAPALPHVLELRGDVVKKQFVSDVTLRGLTFAHTQWMLPEPDPATTQPVSGGYAQADLNVPAAVTGQSLRRVAIEGCTFRHLGTYGLELGRSAQHCHVERCTFDDLGAGGVRIGEAATAKADDERSFANTLRDCTISNGGHTYPAAVGVWVGQASDTLIAHNEIRDFFYSGISVGWTWGYGESLNRGNVIEKNHVHHIGLKSTEPEPILSDMGCVYVLGARKGTVIRNNHFHHVASNKYGGWCIYLDEGSSDVVVENNLAHHATNGTFHQHYGKDNIVRNNLFAFGGSEMQIQRTREEPHLSLTFERNVVQWTSGAMTKTSPNNVKFDRNLYSFPTPADFRANALSWEQWRAAGEDDHSILTAEPIFTDAENGDFTLRRPVPEAIGFKPFDVSDAGPTTKPATRPAGR
jgi:hypothetical protein